MSAAYHCIAFLKTRGREGLSCIYHSESISECVIVQLIGKYYFIIILVLFYASVCAKLTVSAGDWFLGISQATN